MLTIHVKTKNNTMKYKLEENSWDVRMENS